MCTKMIQDISVYFERCFPYCKSNVCPDTTPYYKHPSEDKCVMQCPKGSMIDGNQCVSVNLCHSTCATCSVKNDASKCSGCSSTLSSLSFEYVNNQCNMKSNNNAQPLITVDKNTVLGTSYLKKVTYDSTVEQTSGTSLGSFLYSFNVIEFESFANSI